MAQTSRLAAVVAAGIAVSLSGCATGRPVGSPPRPTVAPSTAVVPAASTTEPLPATSTVAPSGVDANAIAARFAVAYFDWHASDAPDARRRRCRPLDTDAVDQLLALPSWAGAGNTTSSPQDFTAARVDTLNQVETTAAGAGLELTVTVDTTTPAGTTSDRRDVEIWVTPTAVGWRVSQFSVGS